MKKIGSSRKAAWLAALTAASAAAAPPAGAAVALVAEDNMILQQIGKAFQSAFDGPIENIAFAPDAVAKAKSKSPKVIVALGPLAAKQANDGAGDVPVLYAGVLNPGKVGIDGKNVGGVPMNAPIKRQWAAAMKGLKIQKIAVLVSADNAAVKSEAEDAAKELGLKARIVPVSGDGLSEALTSLASEDSDAVWIPLDPAVAQQMAFKAIVDVCVKRKLPLLVPTATYVKQGGLMSVSIAYPEMGKRLARQAKAVVGGASPKAAAAGGEEEITVNKAVAKEIGAALSDDFLKSATSTVE